VSGRSSLLLKRHSFLSCFPYVLQEAEATVVAVDDEQCFVRRLWLGRLAGCVIRVEADPGAQEQVAVRADEPEALSGLGPWVPESLPFCDRRAARPVKLLAFTKPAAGPE
jgi:hypothetical protein